MYVIFCYTSVGMTAFRCAGTHGEILTTELGNLKRLWETVVKPNVWQFKLRRMYI